MLEAIEKLGPQVLVVLEVPGSKDTVGDQAVDICLDSTYAKKKPCGACGLPIDIPESAPSSTVIDDHELAVPNMTEHGVIWRHGLLEPGPQSPTPCLWRPCRQTQAVPKLSRGWVWPGSQAQLPDCEQAAWLHRHA